MIQTRNSKTTAKTCWTVTANKPTKDNKWNNTTGLIQRGQKRERDKCKKHQMGQM